MSDDAIHLRPFPDDATCEIHEWPTEGLGARLVEAMRASHPRGVNACRECIERARDDASAHRPRLYEVGFEIARTAFGHPTEDRTRIAVTPMTAASRVWIHRPEVAKVALELWQRLKMHKVAPDPEPHAAPLPQGTECPRTIALALQVALRAAFPDEEIHAWSRTDPAPVAW